MTEKEAREHMAWRLVKEFRLSTEHGDEITLWPYQADALADIIAEYVAKASSSPALPLPKQDDPS